VGTSIYVFRRSLLAPALRRLSPDNAQGEYYLTDVIAVLHDAGYPVLSMVSPEPIEASGVNDRSQLAAAEAVLRGRINDQWMRKGVTMLDPQHTYLDSTVELGRRRHTFPRDNPSREHESGFRRRDRPEHPFGRLRCWSEGTSEGDFGRAGGYR
jgi:bifunctional UDP-N-acetylglucosamine pyrophosphorylase/glucosamine-1-phosphate N-acetyltransferase